MITGAATLAGAGTQNAGLAFGGYDGCTEEYDGTSWTAGGAMITARKLLAGAGTQNAGLAFGGIEGFPNFGSRACTEEYNKATTSCMVVSGSITATSITETSALRFKQNIHDLESAEAVYKLRPVTFDWKNTKKHDIGFIAEEVQSVIPEMVELSKDGSAESIKYSKLTALIVKALQTQEKLIKDLQQQIDQLKNQ